MFSRRAKGINSQQCGQDQIYRAKAGKAYHSTPSKTTLPIKRTHP
jgi:hypothetical protein